MEFIDIATPPKQEAIPPDKSLSSALEYLSIGESIVVLLHSTARYLQDLTRSCGYIYYKIEQGLEDLYICPTNSSESECLAFTCKWSVRRGETIAIYAFKRKIPILVDASNSVDLNFPYLQSLPTLNPRHVLAIPLVNYHHVCSGVVEFYNNSNQSYSKVKVCGPESMVSVQIVMRVFDDLIRQSDTSLSTQLQFLPSGNRLISLIHSTAEYLKELTHSIGYIIYSLDDIDAELYLCPTDAADSECHETRYKWRMESGGTIAIYAFKKMTPILVDAFSSMDINFPYLQALPGVEPRFILSIPLVSFGTAKFGVVEFYRNGTRQYSEVDVKLCQFLLQNCAEAFKQNESAVYFHKFNSVQHELQGLLEKYAFADDPNGSYKFLYQVVTMARDCTRAMSSSLFFQKANSLVKIVSTDEGFSFRKEEGAKDLGLIVRSVITSHFHTSLMNRNIHGMLRVRNKIGLSNFSLLDEQVLDAFAKMCTIWCIIEYMSGYLKKQKTLNDNLLSLINLQLQRAGDFGKKLRTLVPSEPKILNSWSYILEISADERKLSSDVVVMINKVKGDLPILEEPLRDFVVMIEQCHRSEGDDDYRTTVLAVQALYRLLDGCKGVTKDNDALAMMIAVLSYNISVINEPTAESAIFGRYNQYAEELTRFEICQFIIQETKLLSNCEIDDQNEILKLTKQYMVDINLQCLKRHSLKFSKFATENDVKQLQLKRDPELRGFIQTLLPGIANVLGHLRSKPFLEKFPKFSLFKELEKEKLTCIDIIQTISPTYSYGY